MAQLVLADAGESQVLLEEGGDADPLRVLLAHQVLVVGEGQQELPDAHGTQPDTSLEARRLAATAAPS